MSEKAQKAQAGKNSRKRPCFVEETKKGTLVKKPATTRADRAASTAAHKDGLSDVDARLQEYNVTVTWCERRQMECLRSSDRRAQGHARSLFAAAIVVVTYASRDVMEVAMGVTTKPTADTVHSPTPRQLHVESIQLACTCALYCCYALCMKREELSIFYSLWLRCFVVMLQYVGFFGSKPTFWKPSQRWRANLALGAHQLQSWRANS